MAEYSANLTPIYRISKFLDRLVHGTDAPEPVFRIEFYLAKLAGQDVEIPEPIYRIEFYLAKLCGMDVEIPVPIYRAEFFLAKLCGEEVTPPEVIYRISHWLADWAESGGPGSYYTLTGTTPLTLPHSLAAAIRSLIRTGTMTQTPAPTPDAPVYPSINNGTVKAWTMREIPLAIDTDETGLINKDTGEVDANSSYRITEPIFVPAGDYNVRVTFATTQSARVFRIYAYSADGTPLYLCVTATQKVGEQVYPFTIAADCYIRVNYRYAGNSDISIEAVNPIAYVVGTPEVLSVGGRNLANPALVDGEGWYIVSGKIANSAAANRTIVFPCKPNTTYSWWHCDGVGGMRAFESDTATPTVGDTAAWAVGSPAYKAANVVTTYTTSATAKYLIIDYSRRDSSSTRTHDEQFADFMLVEGAVSEALPYEPYRAPQTATVPDLYAVGDYKDEVDVVAGTVTRRVGKVALTSDLPWFAVTGQTGLFGVPVADGKWAANQLAVSSHYAGTVATNASMPDNTIKATHASTLAPNKISIYVKDTTHGTSLDTFKAWLDAAGVIAIFPLVTPTTESITPQSLRTQDGATVVDSSAGSVEVTAEYKASEEPSAAAASGLMMARAESEDGGAADGS